MSEAMSAWHLGQSKKDAMAEKCKIRQLDAENSFF